MTGRGIYRIHEQDLARLLKLKPGQHVIGVGQDFASLSVLVMVEGPGLPEHDSNGACVEPIGTLRDLWPEGLT
jgi:hypothetical protein